jgi:hypothetical protein
MIAQALGEYGAMQAVVDGVYSIGFHLGEFAREWGLTGASILVGGAIVWKFITRVK